MSRTALPPAVSRRRAAFRRSLYLLLALTIGAGAVGMALAQSGGYSTSLNSPVSFPVDI